MYRAFVEVVQNNKEVVGLFSRQPRKRNENRDAICIGSRVRDVTEVAMYCQKGEREREME